ncbi:hypothetical protein MOMA_09046 [Moraxella macacae 0408225]|uniref:Rhodanese domain-containing protein n=1 Tax=Moraxella macacae 0408225 TaxID=1230338 RepID=L2F8A3_9GAMM|nr:rhodanese-like domain-containing protein [Moraxella macacae]ELA08693.1 hypothetical protein MOMA_09046 [Moraxella macacae 0408225]
MITEKHITDFTPKPTDIIWDVRDQKSYQEGHIEYAKNQPLETLSDDLLASTNGPIYVLCGGGTKAAKAACLLNELDPEREIVHLTGGTRGAKTAGMTIVVEDQ